MTDDEALAILKDCYECVDGDDTGKPTYFDGKVQLDGHFSARELLAILHFAPKEEV